MRLRTSLPFFALIALVGAPSLARPAEKADSRAPALVVRVKPIADIMADLEFLSREAGHEDQGKKANDQMKAFGGKAVDTSRPWGAYAAVGDDLSDVAVVGLVPVAGEKEFQELLERYNLKAEKGDDGISTLNLPLVPVPIYFRVQDHYAYVTARTKGPLAKDRLLDPSKIFTGEGNELVYASFRLDRLPDTVRELALQFIDQGAAKAKEEEQAGETKTQREFRTQALDDLARRVGQILKEGREIRLRLGVDRSAHELTADLDATAKPDTDLARDIAAAGQSSSQFGSLASGDAAISLVVHASLSESMRKALAPVIDEGLREGAKKAKDDAHRQQAEKFLKALEPTLKAGVLDVAFTLRPAGEEHFSMIAAIKVKDGEELEKSVRDLVQTVPEKDRDKIKLDAESIGSVKVHRVDAQGGFDADAKRLFGDNPLYFAFRSDAFFITGGPDGVAAMRQALQAQAKSVPQVQLELSLARLAPLMQKRHPNARQAADAAFGNSPGENDRVRLTVEGGDAVKIHFAMKTPVLRFIDQSSHRRDSSDDADGKRPPRKRKRGG